MRIWHKGIDGIHAFYINGLLRSLFMSLTTIYVPIFIYLLAKDQGATIQKSILLVAMFFVVERLFVVIFLIPLSRLIEQIGFRKSISLSVIFLIGYTMCLYLADKNISWLWLATIFGGIQIPMYWISRDSALSQDVESQQMGTKMGYVAAIENIAGLTGPFVGGTIVLLYGYTSLFLVALAILMLSAVPLWWMPRHSHRNGVSLRGFFNHLKNKGYTHQLVANFASAMNDYGNGVIWPLILFLQGISNEKLGFVYSMVAFVTIAIQFFTGKWFDHLRSRKDYADEGVYGFATIGVAIAWIFRLFASGIGQVVSIDMARQVFGTIHENFYSDYLHLGGKRMGSIAFWVYAEILYSVGAIFIFVVLAMGLYFDIWKELILTTMAIWSIMTIVIARESNL